MYIDDRFFDWQINAGLYLLMASLWLLAYNKSKKHLRRNLISTTALGIAFSLIILMINTPFLGESSAQITGATILSILFGPWYSFFMISSALLIKGFFIDAQITGWAVNSLLLAFITSFSGYYVYKIISSKLSGILGKILSAGIGAYFSVIIPALTAGILLNLQDCVNFITTGKYFSLYIIPENIILIMTHSQALYVGLVESALTLLGSIMLIIEDGYLLKLIVNRNAVE